LSGASAQAASSLPTVAVYNFDERGLQNWWGSNFDPGQALADLVSDRLVGAGTLSVIDRDHLQEVLQEQNLARTGDVTPDTEAKLGRMLGVGYLFVGKIISFDKSSNGSGGLGSLMGGLGGASSTKTTLHASIKIIEASSGRIVAAIDEEQSATSTSFAIGGFGGGSAAAYKSPDFQKSAIGKLFTSAADDIVSKIDASKLVATAPAPTISGKILAEDDGSYVLNIGSDNGVQKGMTFDTLDVKQLTDPDTKKTIISEIPRGTIQVISVTKDSSVAKKISGSVKVRQSVKSE
jgi:curli biogenesis system outer membrane secretion channel CsgG